MRVRSVLVSLSVTLCIASASLFKTVSQNLELLSSLKGRISIIAPIAR
jgi:hypothetical protein